VRGDISSIMRVVFALRLAAIVVAAAGAGCTSLQSSDNVLGFITPYRIEVVQGNVLTREQVALVKPGMSRTQVREALGSPLLADIFHADRWDYVFTIKRQGAEPQRRHVVAIFEGDTLKSLDAADLPREVDFVESISTFKPKRIPALTLSEEQRRALPVPSSPTPSEQTEPQGPARQYPPLEPQS
jgi:outer membrane protein assembly factor BamE